MAWIPQWLPKLCDPLSPLTTPTVLMAWLSPAIEPVLGNEPTCTPKPLQTWPVISSYPSVTWDGWKLAILANGEMVILSLIKTYISTRFY